MANLRGKGNTKGVSLILKQYDNQAFENAKGGGSFIDAEVARFVDTNGVQANPNVPPQKIPNLRNTKSTKKGFEDKYDNGVAYTAEEIANFEKAAGDNIQPLVNNKTGETIGRVLVLDADVIPHTQKIDRSLPEDAKGNTMSFLRINHKSVKPTELAVPENVRDAQFQAIAADREALKNAPEAESGVSAEAPAPEAEAEAAKDEGPDFG